MSGVCFVLGGGEETGMYLIRTKGIGTQRRAKVPNAVDAQRGPSALYSFLANNCMEKALASSMLMVPPGNPTYRESGTENTTDKGLVWHTREPTQKILTFE